MHCVYIYTLCVKLYTKYKITQGSQSIWKNSPYLKNLTPTPEAASATNIRYEFGGSLIGVSPIGGSFIGVCPNGGG